MESQRTVNLLTQALAQLGQGIERGGPRLRSLTIEDQRSLADGDHVSGNQELRRVDALTVYTRAIAAAKIGYTDLSDSTVQPGVLPRCRRIREHEPNLGSAANHHLSIHRELIGQRRVLFKHDEVGALCPF